MDKISCGFLHTSVGTDTGLVFVYGDGRFGQLGLEFGKAEAKELKQATFIPCASSTANIRFPSYFALFRTNLSYTQLLLYVSFHFSVGWNRPDSMRQPIDADVIGRWFYVLLGVW